MKCIIRYSVTKEDQVAPSVTSDLVTVDENLICLSGQDKPIDVIMACLGRETYPEGPGTLRRSLDTLCEKGASNIRMAIMPGAVRRMALDPEFSPESDHLITIRWQIKQSYSPDAWLSLDGSDELYFGMGDIHLAREISGNSSCPVFIDYSSSSRQEEELRTDQAASGAVLTGILDAAFATAPALPPEDLTQERAILTGILCAMAGHDFTHFGAKGCVEWSISACSSQLSAFRQNGFLLSNRSWNPDRLYPGPRLCQAQSLADPEIRKTAARAWQEICAFDKELVCDVAYVLTDAAGIRRTQISSYLKEPTGNRSSQHSRIVIEGQAQKLARLFSVSAKDKA